MRVVKICGNGHRPAEWTGQMNHPACGRTTDHHTITVERPEREAVGNIVLGDVWSDVDTKWRQFVAIWREPAVRSVFS